MGLFSTKITAKELLDAKTIVDAAIKDAQKEYDKSNKFRANARKVDNSKDLTKKDLGITEEDAKSADQIITVANTTLAKTLRELANMIEKK